MYTQKYSGGLIWITDITDPVSYRVTLSDGRILKRHLDQIRVRHDNTPDSNVCADQGATDMPDVPPSPGDPPQPTLQRSVRQTKAPD